MRGLVWHAGCMLVLLMVVCSVLGLQEEEYNIASLPFDEEAIFDITQPENLSAELDCVGSCPFTTCSPTELTFLNSSIPISCSINVPNGTPNDVYEEHYILSNGSILEELFIVLNVTVPETPIVPANIDVIRINPTNNSFIGQFDALPRNITLQYEGEIDFEESELGLKHNGLPIIWFELNHTENQVIWTLGKTPDGIYEGEWVFYDLNGSRLDYYYVFRVRQTAPEGVLSIFPEKGYYTNEVTQLLVTMDSDTYEISYMFSDGMPPQGSKDWKPLGKVQDIYSINGLNFNTAGIGALYLKIVDQFRNIKIQPTGIVSGPALTMDIATSKKGAEPGDTVTYELDIDIKPGSGNLLSCKLDNFIANEGDKDEKKWTIRNTAEMYVDGYDSNEDEDADLFIDVFNEYEDKIILKKGLLAESLLLDVLVPRNVLEDNYDSRLECIVS